MCWCSPSGEVGESVEQSTNEEKELSDDDKTMLVTLSQLPRFQKRRTGTCEQLLLENLISDNFYE